MKPDHLIQMVQILVKTKWTHFRKKYSFENRVGRESKNVIPWAHYISLYEVSINVVFVMWKAQEIWGKKSFFSSSSRSGITNIGMYSMFYLALSCMGIQTQLFSTEQTICTFHINFCTATRVWLCQLHCWMDNNARFILLFCCLLAFKTTVEINTKWPLLMRVSNHPTNTREDVLLTQREQNNKKSNIL